MNGLPYDEALFLSDTKVLDDIVIYTCPTINGMSDRYDRIYLHQSNINVPVNCQQSTS